MPGMPDKNKTRINGYMTVYLTLTMTVLLSLCLTLIEGARSSAIKLESEIAVSIASDSIMAEYNRELFRQYNIFAIEDSYGTDHAAISNIDEHLANYMTKNLSGDDIFLGRFFYRDFLGLSVENAKTEKAMYLTDYDGRVFKRRAYEVIKDDIGLTAMKELVEYANVIEARGFDDQGLTDRMYGLQSELDSAQRKACEEKKKEAEEAKKRREEKAREREADKAEQKEDGEEGDDKPEESEAYDELDEEISEVHEPYNPASDAIARMNPLLLYQYVENVNDLSENIINTSELLSGRKRAGKISTGNLELEEEGIVETGIEKFAFREYLMRYMGNYLNVDKEDALRYQIEYVIGGMDADIDNLVAVVGMINAIRFVESYLYIQGDDEKKAGAKVLATVIAVYTYTEEFIDQYTELILLVWACAEAQHDVKCLLAGSRIEPFKNSDNWFTTLPNILDPIAMENTDGDESGLRYEDFLRTFMLVLPDKIVTTRAMDIIESDVRLTEGNKEFRMDSCVDTVELMISTYSSFGYENNFRVRKRYE